MLAGQIISPAPQGIVRTDFNDVWVKLGANKEATFKRRLARYNSSRFKAVIVAGDADSSFARLLPMAVLRRRELSARVSLRQLRWPGEDGRCLQASQVEAGIIHGCFESWGD